MPGLAMRRHAKRVPKVATLGRVTHLTSPQLGRRFSARMAGLASLPEMGRPIGAVRESRWAFLRLQTGRVPICFTFSLPLPLSMQMSHTTVLPPTLYSIMGAITELRLASLLTRDTEKRHHRERGRQVNTVQRPKASSSYATPRTVIFGPHSRTSGRASCRTS